MPGHLLKQNGSIYGKGTPGAAGGGGGDVTAPAVVVSSASGANVELPYSVTFTFSEDVAGFVVGDITVTNGAAGTFATVSASVYTATITPTAPGAVTVQVAAGVCADLAGNLNTASNVLSRTYVTLQLTATTAAPGVTVTLQRITPTGANVTVNWGDGGTSTILAGNTGTTTHVYASAGTYAITISNPAILTYIDLRDAKVITSSQTLLPCVVLATLRLDSVLSFNSADIASMPLTSLSLALNAVGGSYVFNTTHIASMSLTLLSLSCGTVGSSLTINSADIASMPLTSLSLGVNPVGSYMFNTAHIAGMDLVVVNVTFPVVGTFVFDSAHIAGMANATFITFYFHVPSLTKTINRADFAGLVNCASLRIEMGLSAASQDAILLGFYDGFPAKVAVGGTMDLVGNSNLAPSGTSPGSAECPPTTGYNARYELINDSCGVSTKHWTTIDVP